MKRLIAICAALVMIAGVSAQAPYQMSYQAVIRNSSNVLVADQAIGMRISILQDSSSGSAVYVETQTPTSNSNGLVSIAIGSGTVVSGTISSIDWMNGPYFIKTETDPTGGTSYSITGTSQLLSVPYSLHAKTAENLTGYAVGDFTQGGIVFWVDESGQHGLVAAKTDQSSGLRWYAGTWGSTQAKGDGPFSGEANTSIIIAAQVALGDDEAEYAARTCNELQITEGGKTYGDWYLPSSEELNLMFLNKAAIEATALAVGGSAFAPDIYWSSTEYDNIAARSQNLGTGTQYFGFGKNSLYKVRAIRAF